ncbi:uncharacterized protein LOC143628489 [Bidens hawaiensis]|uniref:uncharacterized protein LOC143628489 n=1 Tax=Bidens hawaiensis TaxID=980011 RepID=UPI00404B0A53
MNDGGLYRRSFLGPLLRCVDAEDVNYLIREVHEGIYDLHAGPRMTVAKLMNAGYYWLGMHLDDVQEIRKCDSCQRNAPNTLRPKNELIPVTSAWPFQKWAIDIMGPFPEAPRPHPQANGQVERTNRIINEGIKARLGTKRTGWVDELPHVLWAFRTQKNSSNSETPFSLTYGTEAMIPAEIGIPSARVLLIDDNDHELRMYLNLLEERRKLA